MGKRKASYSTEEIQLKLKRISMVERLCRYFTITSVRRDDDVELLLPEVEDGEGRVGLAVEGAAFERRYLVVLESQT